MYKRFLLVVLLAALLLAGCGSGAGDQAAQIAGREWVLTTIHGQPALEGAQVTLKLEGSQAGGSAGCNSYGGEYRLRGSQLSFGSLMMTEMACMDNGVMDQEIAYLQSLGQVTAFTMQDGQLQLQNAAGETVLVFR